MPEDTTQPINIPGCVIALILWIATAVLGLLDILAVRNMILEISARLWADAGRSGYLAAVNVSNWSVVAMALIWIVVVIGGGEYHRGRVGQRSSWKLFGWIIGVEVAILLLRFFI